MKEQTLQEVQKANEGFQERLQKALHDARIEFEVEKDSAIREAREEEINNAFAEASRCSDLEEERRKKIILDAEKEKAVWMV